MVKPEKVEFESNVKEGEESRTEKKKVKFDTSDILAFGFLCLCIGAVMVGLVVAGGMALGKIDTTNGIKLLGEMFGASALSGIVSAFFARKSKKRKKMNSLKTRTLIPKILPLLFLFSLAVNGCGLKLIADYDSATLEQTLEVGKKVDLFYGNLLEAKETDRAYSKYSAQYVQIEVDLRALKARNEARSLNKESTRIAEIILKKWVKYKDAHKERNSYKNALSSRHRERFMTLFQAAGDAEKAKNMETSDND